MFENHPHAAIAMIAISALVLLAAVFGFALDVHATRKRAAEREEAHRLSVAEERYAEKMRDWAHRAQREERSAAWRAVHIDPWIEAREARERATWSHGAIPGEIVAD